MLMNFHNVNRNERSEWIEYIINAMPQELMPKNNEFLRTEDIWQFGILLPEMSSPVFRKANAESEGWWRCYTRDIRADMLTHLEIGELAKNLLYDMLQFYP